MSRDENVLVGVLTRVWRYVRGNLTLIAVDTVVYTVFFWLLGIPWFLLFGIIIGLSCLVPFFGLPVAGLLTVIWCLVSGLVWWKILLTAVLLVLYGGVIEEFVVSPLLVGGALGLTPLEAFLAIVVGMLSGNVFGLLFALPVAGVLKYLYQQLKKKAPGC